MKPQRTEGGVAKGGQRRYQKLGTRHEGGKNRRTDLQPCRRGRKWCITGRTSFNKTGGGNHFAGCKQAPGKGGSHGVKIDGLTQ